MDVKGLSSRYRVRKLGEEDVDGVLELCVKNVLFYRYHPPLATRESILEDMAALPPRKEDGDKFYIGFYDGDLLVAVMDLILDYPQCGTAYIGFFMVDMFFQGKGIGTDIISDVAGYLKECGFKKIRLAVDEGNPQSEAFWRKNRFVKTGERCLDGEAVYLPMEMDNL